MREIVCPPGFSDRLDRALPRLVEGLSRTQARKLIAAGSVFLDGRRCRVASRPVHAGTRLRLETAAAPMSGPALVVLHVDDDCIAVDKPAGMPSAPTRQAAAGTALEVLRTQLRDSGGDLWLVHRLDAATSGVLLFARRRAAARRLDALFRQRRAAKEYVAWVSGSIAGERGSIDAPLKRSGRRSIVVDTGGQTASTTWEVVQRRGERTLVRLLPATGRMHQLRAHMQSIGHPIAGDRLYGGPPAPRLMLHALRLRLPRDGGQPDLEIEAPLPEGFE